MLSLIAKTRSMASFGARQLSSDQPNDASGLDSFDLLAATGSSKKMITGYWNQGFEINGVFVAGSQILLPTLSFHWDVVGPADITPESLTLFRLLKSAARRAARPTSTGDDGALLFELASALQVDLLLIGTGAEQHFVSPAVVEMLAGLGISVESMSTSAAIGTFNCLNQEDRMVAAALLCNQPTSPRTGSLTTTTFLPSVFGL